MTKKAVSEATLAAKSEAAARRKCTKSLVAWSAKPVSKESLDYDHPDGFHLHDWTGSGSFEAFAGRLEQSLASAPCGQCPRDDCPGSLEGCLLEMDPGVLQDQMSLAEEAERGEMEAFMLAAKRFGFNMSQVTEGVGVSDFVAAAIDAGFSYDKALRMEDEMNRLAGEMDSIH